MKKDIKAVFFDIDGTLVSFNTHKVPQSAIDTIGRLKAAGIKVFIATGRHQKSINNLGDLTFDGYVTINGGITILNNQIIHKKAIAQSEIVKINQHMKQGGNFPCTFVLEDRLVMNYRNDDVDKLFDLLNFLPPEEGDLEEASKEPVYQLISFFKEDEEDEILKLVPECSSVRWNELFADIVPKGTSKVLGISKIAEQFGITSDNIMAFGDGGNDIEMLQYAGIGIAMGNAEEHVKAIANDITDTVDNDGIQKAIEKHLGI